MKLFPYLRSVSCLGWVLVLSTCTFLSACSEQGSGPILAKVGDRNVRKSEIEVLTRVNPRLKTRLETEEGQQKILENFVEQELLYQGSKAKNLDKSPDVREKIDLYRKIIIAQTLLDQEMDTQTRLYYDNHRDEFEKVKISHLLLKLELTETPEKKPETKKDSKKAAKNGPKKRTRAETEALMEKIQKESAGGTTFADLAKKYSEDSRSSNQGGSLGEITLTDRRLERWGWLKLAEKAFSLKKDETVVVETKEGLHLIRLDEEKSLIPFEKAEMNIRFRLQGKIREDLLTELKKKFPVTYPKTEKSTENSKQIAPLPPPQPEIQKDLPAP